jgi:deoxyxylulose-5-phosphate synthase
MAHWQASITRAPPKSKAELRQMLTEAVRNTQPSAERRPKHSPKAEKDQP